MASRLAGEIVAEPDAGLLLDITGPGGCGKTPLLEAVARSYTDAGVPVIRDPGEAVDLIGAEGVAGLSGVAVLIDDAQRLDADGLARLEQLARAPGQRLTVAHRRWPASVALTALGTALTARRPPMVLGHLDRPAIAVRISELLGTVCPEPLAKLMYEQTAGLPVLLDQLVTGLRDSGQLSADAVRQLAPRARLDVPAGVREQLRYVIEALPAEVRNLLFAATLSTGNDTGTLSRLLEMDGPDVDQALQSAQATGLMTDYGAVVPLVGRLLLRLTPATYTNQVCDRLARLHLERGGAMLAAGQALLRASAHGPQVAAVLQTAADEALGASPDLAGRLFAAAAAAGARSPALLTGRADAAARCGRFDEALRLADEALTESGTDGARGSPRARALGITAAVLAHRGLLGRAGQLYRLAGTNGAGHPLVAVPVLAGVGALGEAQQALAAAGQPDTAPTLLSGVELLIAHGVTESISGSPVAALSQLSRAASLLESAGSTPLLPDTPAALAALVAMHEGEFAAATSVLRRAVSARQGGRLAATRHRLLLAFLAMTRGYTADARDLLTAAAADRPALEPRDELFAAAIAVGLARREGDLSALRTGWSRAREALLQHPVDLYVMLPLGELAVAAARLSEQWWIEPHLRQAEALLGQLGQPVLWAVPLHWYGVHAAITGESPQQARQHVSALAATATAGPYPALLAGAASCWMQVLAGTAEVDLVMAAARQLATAGLGSEGARLAGQAAIRATDRKSMTVLLECARAVRPDVPSGPAEPGPTPARDSLAAAQRGPDAVVVARPPGDAPGGGHARPGPVPDVTLSAREQEIARRVLTGLTYKEIGAQLFISAKTVEHHMARIRRRLGATSRRELFGQLRAMLNSDQATPHAS
ncbi:MAG TPA: LuxR C-terminal-related transcriptional regulator [Streptosporangiaceae bacterium]|nr:LuxR C-terminal-related transcriptional regulator [Streptosporangiaceae bacterium]